MTTATFGKGDSHGGYGGYGDHGKGKGEDYHGHGGGYGGGTACIVKGSYCQCHYCKCEHGFLHCGKGKDGYGGHKGWVAVGRGEERGDSRLLLLILLLICQTQSVRVINLRAGEPGEILWDFFISSIFSYGKKYCYGSMEGEHCHCDYCKCKHGFGTQGYGKGGCGGGGKGYWKSKL